MLPQTCMQAHRRHHRSLICATSPVNAPAINLYPLPLLPNYHRVRHFVSSIAIPLFHRYFNCFHSMTSLVNDLLVTGLSSFRQKIRPCRIERGYNFTLFSLPTFHAVEQHLDLLLLLVEIPCICISVFTAFFHRQVFGSTVIHFFHGKQLMA